MRCIHGDIVAFCLMSISCLCAPCALVCCDSISNGHTVRWRNAIAVLIACFCRRCVKMCNRICVSHFRDSPCVRIICQGLVFVGSCGVILRIAASLCHAWSCRHEQTLSDLAHVASARATLFCGLKRSCLRRGQRRTGFIVWRTSCRGSLRVLPLQKVKSRNRCVRDCRQNNGVQASECAIGVVGVRGKT